MAFKPLSMKEIQRAIGDTQGLSETMQRAFQPGDDFAPLPVPRRGDWLAEHYEPGQTFDQYVISSPPRPDRLRQKIYLQPLGDFPEGSSPPLEKLREFAACFFMMDVKVLAVLPLTTAKFTSRINPSSGKRQILTRDVLRILWERKPRDAFCILAITMEDLYPDPSWNFVFGQASPQNGVGVFSFARYDPAFYGEPSSKGYGEILLRRSLKVLAHETCHMFSLAHCIYFHCLMNGSNHLQESDARPMFLCPVCLRKLWFSIGFDIVERYQKLLRFYENVGLDKEAGWVSRRLAWIMDKHVHH